MKHLWFGAGLLALLLAVSLWLGNTLETVHHTPARDLDKAAQAALEEIQSVQQHSHSHQPVGGAFIASAVCGIVVNEFFHGDHVFGKECGKAFVVIFPDLHGGGIDRKAAPDAPVVCSFIPPGGRVFAYFKHSVRYFKADPFDKGKKLSFQFRP